MTQLSDEAVERVARALFDHEWDSSEPAVRDELWATMDHGHYWNDAARAAIAAYEAKGEESV